MNPSQIKPHMEVVGADGVHVGTVDRVEGQRLKLTKKDSGQVTRTTTIMSTSGSWPRSKATRSGCQPTAMSQSPSKIIDQSPPQKIPSKSTVSGDTGN